MPITKDLVTDSLRHVPGPAAGTDVVTGGYLVSVSACDTYASVKLQLPGLSVDALRRLAAAAHESLCNRAESQGTRVDSFIVECVDEKGSAIHTAKFGATPPAPAGKPSAGSAPGHTPIGGLRPGASRPPTPQGAAAPLPGVKHIVAVGAGKGGVGKSTVALNLAVGLARRGMAVGILDGDIYGPSMPTMLGLESHDTVVHEGMLQPFYLHGVKVMTMGKLVDPDKPLIWRGPMAHGAFKQLAEQTNWGELDYLIIDLPPGTGDVSLTMAQLLQLTGAVVVCTPQKVAQDDAVRASHMFQQLGIEVLGVVENMSYFVGDDGNVYDIFGRGGAEKMAQRLGVPFLGEIPITMSLRVNSDNGDPSANFIPSDEAGRELARCLESVVSGVESQVAAADIRHGQTRPTLTIS
jgi:ATP-binding protein involved in chromosome partitioning